MTKPDYSDRLANFANSPATLKDEMGSDRRSTEVRPNNPTNAKLDISDIQWEDLSKFSKSQVEDERVPQTVKLPAKHLALLKAFCELTSRSKVAALKMAIELLLTDPEFEKKLRNDLKLDEQV